MENVDKKGIVLPQISADQFVFEEATGRVILTEFWGMTDVDKGLEVQIGFQNHKLANILADFGNT
jgi:hypothetical protein